MYNVIIITLCSCITLYFIDTIHCYVGYMRSKPNWAALNGSTWDSDASTPSITSMLSPYHRKIHDNFVPMLFEEIPDEICGVKYSFNFS